MKKTIILIIVALFVVVMAGSCDLLGSTPAARVRSFISDLDRAVSDGNISVGEAINLRSHWASTAVESSFDDTNWNARFKGTSYSVKSLSTSGDNVICVINKGLAGDSDITFTTVKEGNTYLLKSMTNGVF